MVRTYSILEQHMKSIRKVHGAPRHEKEECVTGNGGMQEHVLKQYVAH